MIDAIVIAESESTTFSTSTPLRLQFHGRTAWIQTIHRLLETDDATASATAFIDRNNWSYAPKLNGIRLFSYLQSQGHTVALVDSYFTEKERFIKLLATGPRAVVISTTFICTKKALTQLVRDIRSLAPDVFIVVGGTFVYSSYLLLQRSVEPDYDSLSPRDDFLFLSTADNPEVDLYIVDRGGEPILSEVLRRLAYGGDPFNLSNTCRLVGNQYVFSPRNFLSPVDMSVNWSSVPDEVFRSGCLNVQASVGCPYKCEFCNFVKEQRHAKMKSLPDLITELREISTKGIKYVRFVDDNFRLGRHDLDQVCKEFIHNDLGIKWMSFLRASAIAQCDPELLRQAGCVEVNMGIESADPLVLQNMNKRTDPELYRSVLRRLLATGINCNCFFIIGFPGETTDSVKRTVDFINSIPKDTDEGLFCWSIYPFILAPLSPVYEPQRRAKYALDGYLGRWKHATMDSTRAYELTKNVYMTITGSSQIYSGDDMDMMLAMSAQRRRQFVNLRHELSKTAAQGMVDQAGVLKAFSEILAR
jgi:anaerobic magnesium-protoporphyrin IX monomethyl ester cyclase